MKCPNCDRYLEQMEAVQEALFHERALANGLELAARRILLDDERSFDEEECTIDAESLIALDMAVQAMRRRK